MSFTTFSGSSLSEQSSTTSICISSEPGASTLSNLSPRYVAQLKVGIITDHNGRLILAGIEAIRGLYLTIDSDVGISLFDEA